MSLNVASNGESSNNRFLAVLRNYAGDALLPCCRVGRGTAPPGSATAAEVSAAPSAEIHLIERGVDDSAFRHFLCWAQLVARHGGTTLSGRLRRQPHYLYLPN